MSVTDQMPESRLFERVAAIIEAVRGEVARSVNTAMVHAYWHVGREIVEVDQVLRPVGVTEHKRRGHYRHAGELVAACFGCDRSAEAARWVASMKAEYQRFPALRAELERALASA